MDQHIIRAFALFSIFAAITTASRPAGCGKHLPGNQSPGNFTSVPDFVTSDNTTRAYIIHIPSNYNADGLTPLIFSFHGRGKSAGEQMNLSRFNDENWNPDAIAVYPQGLKGSAGKAQWQGDPNSVDVDDVGFVMDMIDSFSSLYCINPNRIFAAGKSNGGGFTGLLACNETASTRIAAFAPVSGAFYQALDEDGKCDAIHVPITCNPGRKPVPILEFHGGADRTIPYSGGKRREACLPTIPHWVREWSKRDGYGLHNRTTSSFDGNVLEYQYGGDDGVLGIVTHYLIKGLGHDWPSKEPNGDNPNGTYIDATPLIVDFFSRWPLDWQG